SLSALPRWWRNSAASPRRCGRGLPLDLRPVRPRRPTPWSPPLRPRPSSRRLWLRSVLAHLKQPSHDRGRKHRRVRLVRTNRERDPRGLTAGPPPPSGWAGASREPGGPPPGPPAEPSIFAHDEEVPLSPNGAAHVQPRPPRVEAAPPESKVSADDRGGGAAVEALKASRLDFLFRSKPARPVSQRENFDAAWP